VFQKKYIIGAVVVLLLGFSAGVFVCTYQGGIGIFHNGDGTNQVKRDLSELTKDNQRLTATIAELQKLREAERLDHLRAEERLRDRENRIRELERTESLQRTFIESAIRDSEELAGQNSEFGSIIQEIRKRGPVVKD
jgi:hypothetical protein